MTKRPLLILAVLFTAQTATAVEVTIDRSTTHQTMEGFGFFGAMDSWWGNPTQMISDEWATKVIVDLGISIWRNEYYPPKDSMDFQDADWTKQKPVVQALKRIADANKVPLKFLVTVWTPPSAMKCSYSDSSQYLPVEGTSPQSTKGGHTLCKNSWDQFAEWLVAGLQLYKDIGIDVYGLSFQNEPYFNQPYNSCFYVQDYYAQTLAYIGPKIKAAFPQVKLFGAENMLAMEAGDSADYFYTGRIKNSAAATAALDAIAVHGYNDGLVPTAASKMSTLWSTMYSKFSKPMNKPLWMTETSGYGDTWTSGPAVDGKTYPGAADLAYSIVAALTYGNLSAWVWWQGSQQDELSVYNLMLGTQKVGKRYYVSKQFYRFIRPGARRVSATSDNAAVLATAFDHPAMNAFTAVLINTTAQAQVVNLTGANLPAGFTLYTTSPTDDCANKGAVGPSITLPPNSVNTVVSGNVYESEATSPVKDAGLAAQVDGGLQDAGAASAKSSGCGCRFGHPSVMPRWLSLVLGLVCLEGIRRKKR